MMISIIIPVYNDDELLSLCLQSIQRNSYSNYEIIVVDDGSPMPFSGEIEDLNFTYLRHAQNKGAGAARNTGALEAKGDILLFIDSDIELYPDSLQKIADEFEKKPYLSALTVPVSKENRFRNFFSLYKTAFYRWASSNMQSEVAYMCTTCAAIRKDIFRKAGCFSEEYKGASWEDWEMAFALIEHGGRIELSKNIEVKHNKKMIFKTFLKNEFSRTVDFIALLIKKRTILKAFKKRGLGLAIADRGAACALAMVCVAFGLVAVGPVANRLGFFYFSASEVMYMLLVLLLGFVGGSFRFLMVCYDTAGLSFAVKVFFTSIFVNLIYGLGTIAGLIKVRPWGIVKPSAE